MKMVLTSATDPDAYIACLSGWQHSCARALRSVVRHAAPELDERLKWGHLVYLADGPVLLIRAEPSRVLFGFWEGQRLRHIEPRLRPGGKYQMATLELKEGTPFLQETAVRLATEASRLSRMAGDAKVASPSSRDS
ncbi:hypothetical protein Y695_02362 [Hydrogenophaga sp. T4]|nr:hypothetical protein Y695_02362 [Hydrogenophaga sp. T4]